MTVPNHARVAEVPSSLWSLPAVPPQATPQLRLLRQAWELGLSTEATPEGVHIAYYELSVDGVTFPGARPWISRWQALRTAVSMEGRRVSELGSNLALLSTFALREGGARAALAVDKDARVLEGARLIAQAYGVPLLTRVQDFDDPAGWEADLEAFEADIVCALSLLEWVRDKDRLLRFLRRFPEVIYEGHGTRDAEVMRLRAAGFAEPEFLGLSDRGRPLLRARPRNRS